MAALMSCVVIMSGLTGCFTRRPACITPVPHVLSLMTWQPEPVFLVVHHDINVEHRLFEAEYEVIKVLGKGTYGKAVLVSRKLDQRLFVVKQVELQDLDDHERAATLNEVAA